MNFAVNNLIGIILLVSGILNLFGIMVPYAQKMRRKYTEESIKKWIRPMGVASIIMGVGCILLDTSSFSNTPGSIPGWFPIAGLLITIIGAILGFSFNKIFLKKIK
ncbi:MAG: hypothetical protein PHD56_04200 [Anaerostipes sp.]|nr:hypothetical protein [Anaerostipes sp.]